MKILITGANGFIGSHLARYFVERGDEVDGTWRRTLKDEVTGCRYIHIDLAEKNLEPKQYDCVIHCAAQVKKGNTWDYIRNCILSTQRLLDFCEKQQIEKLIFMSSIAVYGECSGTVDEDSKGVNLEQYGMAKRLCEELINESTIKNRYIIRLSRILGKGGEMAPGGQFIAKAAEKMMKGESVFYTNGNVLYNNLFHITDLLNFCEFLMLKDIEGCFCIGVGAEKPLSIKNILSLLRDEMGSGSELRGGKGSSVMTCHQIDISRMESLGFHAMDVAETIRRFSKDEIERYTGPHIVEVV